MFLGSVPEGRRISRARSPISSTSTSRLAASVPERTRPKGPRGLARSWKAVTFMPLMSEGGFSRIEAWIALMRERPVAPRITVEMSSLRT